MISILFFAIFFITLVMFENSPPVPIEAIEINTELVVSEEKIGYYFF